MKRLSKYLALVNLVVWFFGALPAQDNFRIRPYLQNPAPDAMSILWFSGTELPGTLKYREQGGANTIIVESIPVQAESLAYTLWEDTTFFGGDAPSAPYKHRVRLENLQAGSLYVYHVIQGIDTFASSFRTAPDGNEAIRLIIYADCETEPGRPGSPDACTWQS